MRWKTFRHPNWPCGLTTSTASRPLRDDSVIRILEFVVRCSPSPVQFVWKFHSGIHPNWLNQPQRTVVITRKAVSGNLPDPATVQ